MKRRRFLASAASVAFIPTPSSGTNPYADPHYVHALAGRLAHTEEQIGGMPLVGEAVRHVQHVAPAIERHEKRLQSAGSRLARNAALVLHDTRHLDRAEQVAALSLALARKAEDVQGQAEAYDTLALIRTYGAPATRAVEYARRGLALDGLDDAARARLLVRLGRSLAVLPGQERQVRRALEDAQELADRLPPVESAEIMANSGIALSDCGLFSLGAVDLQSAASAVEARSPLLLALYRARLAKSAIRARDLGGTVQAMNGLSQVVPLVTSRRLDIHVRHILGEARVWRAVPEIRDARGQLAQVTT